MELGFTPVWPSLQPPVGPPFPPELGYSVNLKPSESLSPEGRDSVLPVCVVLSPCLGVLQSTWPHGPSSL